MMMIAPRILVLALVAGVAGCSGAVDRPDTAPALPDRATIVDAARAAMADGDLRAGERLVTAHEQTHGRSPQSVLAYSWIGRSALGADRLDEAERASAEAYSRGLALLDRRGMDDEPDLPIAIGAAIEVQGQSAARRGLRSEAVAYLNGEMTKFADTSMVKRIQKNIHIVSLAGERGPALSGVALPEGDVTVLFFWAHWCADCKRQGPILQELLARHQSAGLTVIAPTQRFGYAAAGEPASPAAETAYIAQVRAAAYPWIPESNAPLDEANHLAYGVSTTPTIVIVDRWGRVRKFHPGVMTLEALEAEILPLLTDN
jgi:thiol-disulfide isomerase/thioredoxin